MRRSWKLTLCLLTLCCGGLVQGDVSARRYSGQQAAGGVATAGFRSPTFFGTGGGGARTVAPTLSLGQAPTAGSEEALVTIILFYNFRCYYGNYVWDTYQEMAREFPGVFRLYFKHHAINKYNKMALLAAQASVAAQAQGKFWELAEILFRNRNNISHKNLENYAQEIGLKMGPYKAAMNKASYRTRIEAEVAESKAFLAGSTSCPTVWINGEKMQGYISTWRLKAVLRKAAREVQGIRIRPLL